MLRRVRAAIIGCGRIASTIDDEVVGNPHYPFPFAHAPAYRLTEGVDLVAGADVNAARLADFQRRWEVPAGYRDYRQLLERERPDMVSVTTRPAVRPEVVLACAEAGVRLIFATKPLCHALAEGDAMLAACARRGVRLVTAAHLNWDPWYDGARGLFSAAEREGPLGVLRSMVCVSPQPLSNLHSHTLCLFRLFAGAPPAWAFGHADDETAAAGEGDLRASGYVVYRNGVRALFDSGLGRVGHAWNLAFYGERGWVSATNAHAHFETWAQVPGVDEPVRLQFPNPWRPRSSMLAAVEGLVADLRGEKEAETGWRRCPGEFGLEALEVAIALRESHRRGGVRVDLPLEDRALRMVAVPG